MKAQLRQRPNDWTQFEIALFNSLTLDEHRVGMLTFIRRLEIAQKMIDAMEQALVSDCCQEFCTASTIAHSGAQG